VGNIGHHHLYAENVTHINRPTQKLKKHPYNVFATGLARVKHYGGKIVPHLDFEQRLLPLKAKK
jgi:hypothetical protein